MFTQETFARSFVLSSTSESKGKMIGLTVGSIFLILFLTGVGIWYGAHRRRRQSATCHFELEKDRVSSRKSILPSPSTLPLPSPSPPPSLPPPRPLPAIPSAELLPPYPYELSARHSAQEKSDTNYLGHPAFRVQGTGSPVSPEDGLIVRPLRTRKPGSRTLYG